MEILKNSKIIIKELGEVFEKINYADVEKVIEMIESHNRIFLIGVGREGLATKSFAMRLMHAGKEVYWAWDDTTTAVTENDLFIITSGSGEIGHIHYVAEEINKIGASTVLVTGVKGRKTEELVDKVMWVPASVYNGDDTVVSSIQPMGNLFEQSLLLLFDMMIMEISSRDINLTFDNMSNRHRNFE